MTFAATSRRLSSCVDSAVGCNGLSFELALGKSFNQVNEFLNKQLNNEEFNEKVFKCLKNV